MSDKRCDLILEAIREYIEENAIPPTYRELSEMTGITSTSMLRYHLDHLVTDGLIRRRRGSPRSITLREEARA